MITVTNGKAPQGQVMEDTLRGQSLPKGVGPIMTYIASQIIVYADCPHCHGTGQVHTPPIGKHRCGGCGGTGKK